MALSNWDMLAFDSDGKPCSGRIKGFLEGTSCEIHKNRLYVHDSKSRRKSNMFSNGTIAQIYEGELSVSDFHIVAARGPQDSIFVIVESLKHHEQEDGKPYRPPDVRRMAGIGCYGFSYIDYDELRVKFGLDPEYEGFSFGCCTIEGKSEAVVTFVTNDNDGKAKLIECQLSKEEACEYDYKWLGVLPSTYAEFIKWLKLIDSFAAMDDYAVWLAKVEASEPLRANQGDMFFAVNAGIELPVTAPGEAEQPILMDICSNKAD